MRTRSIKNFDGIRISKSGNGQDEKVLCPDCNTEYITIKAFNSGKVCRMCSHRLMWANKKGVPYIKYKDLSEIEKIELQTKKIQSTTQKVKRDTKPILTVAERVKPKEPATRGRRVQQPQYIIDYIRTLGDENLTARELYAILLKKYPEAAETLTMVQFQKRLYSDKIPFRRLTTKEKADLAHEGRKELFEKRRAERLNTTSPLDVEKPFKENNIPDSTKENNNIKDNSVDISEERINKKITNEQRFGPIEKEVRQVLENKYKAVNCELGYDFSVDDYLDAFKILRFLINNFNTIVKKRNDMWDITNGYQTDIIHTMENEISEIGDTTLQDKLHILRDIRRGYEIDIACVELMKPFLRTMAKRSNELTDVINKLENQKQRQDNPKYVPNVDIGMVDKYDWAQKTNPSQYKIMDKQLLVTNNKFNKKKGENVYVLRYTLSGAGYGVYKNFSKEFSYPTLKEAEEVMNSFLAELKAKNPGVLVQKTGISQKWN